MRRSLLPLPLVFLVAAGIHRVAPAQSAMHQKTAPTPSTTLVVQVGGQDHTFTASELEALPQTKLEVTNAHTHRNETYTGPLLADVLAKAGMALSPETQHQLLDSYLLATGTDGYFVVYSGAEVEPSLSHAQVIVALTVDGHTLERNGAFQLVASEDVKPARWVRNLDRVSLHPVQAPR